MEKLTDQDLRRAEFEDIVFNRRFRASIKRTGRGGMFELMSEGCPMKDELCKRTPHPDPKKAAIGIEDYADDTVSAMWYGWRKAVLTSRHGETT